MGFSGGGGMCEYRFTVHLCTYVSLALCPPHFRQTAAGTVNANSCSELATRVRDAPDIARMVTDGSVCASTNFIGFRGRP